jgi:hypothetical protein
MPQSEASLDFSENPAQVDTISNQPASDFMPQPLADWLIRILARVRANQSQSDLEGETK